MSAMTRILPTGRRQDDGAAMVMVLVFGVGLLLLSLVMSTAVTRMIRPSDDAEMSFRAWTAAEAGIDDFRARVAAARNGDLSLSLSADTNAALAGWVPIPGVEDPTATDTRFTYSLDTSRMSSAGRIIITSTGYAGGQYRTVRAELAKRTMFDYAYASAYETVAPMYPDYYTGPPQEYTRAEAEAYCGNRYWYRTGPIPPYLTSGWPVPNHRDSTGCVGDLIANWALGQNDKFVGRVHTNDVFTLATTSANVPNVNPSTIFADGAPTTSCPPSQAGVSVGCPDNHRWIAGNVIDGNSYVTDETQGPAYPGWSPQYEAPIEIRTDGRETMKDRAEEAGCIFTGPTRLRFHPDGTLVVTSPDSRSANPTVATIDCGGTALVATDPRVPSPRALTVSDLGPDFNGIIYVQDVPEDAADPNAWSSTAPSCQDKVPGSSGSQPFPYVVTASSVTGSNGVAYADNNGFSQTQTLYGFPSEGTNYTGNQRETFSTDLDLNSTGQSCRRGTAYIEGVYRGRWTVVTEGDTAITSDIVDADVAASLRPSRLTSPSPVRSPVTGWGAPPATSTSVMGLVPDRLLYVYGCSSEKGCGAWDRARMTTNLVLNVATVVVDGCLTVMDSTLTTDYGRLTVVGSLGQKYRCPIAKPSGNSGFGLYVEYDSRFARGEPPPYMAELSQEPWRVQSLQEIRTPTTLPDLTED